MSTLTSVDQILKTRVNSFHKRPFLNSSSSFTSILAIFPPIFIIFHLFILRYFTWMGSISHVISVFTALFFSFCCGWTPGQNWKHENGKNGQFTSCTITKALDTREAWCTTTRTKITFNCMWKKRHFHKKGWAPEQALKKRLKVMGKWSISMVGTSYMIPIVPLTCWFLTGSHVWGSLSVQNTFAELMWEWPNTAGTWSCA